MLAILVFSKIILEFWYLFLFNLSLMIYVLVFVQGGNVWRFIWEYNFFDFCCLVGFGFWVFLFMFGIFGFDYGIGFDKFGVDWIIQGLGNFNIIFGFELE